MGRRKQFEQENTPLRSVHILTYTNGLKTQLHIPVTQPPGILDGSGQQSMKTTRVGLLFYGVEYVSPNPRPCIVWV